MKCAFQVTVGLNVGDETIPNLPFRIIGRNHVAFEVTPQLTHSSYAIRTGGAASEHNDRHIAQTFLSEFNDLVFGGFH